MEGMEAVIVTGGKGVFFVIDFSAVKSCIDTKMKTIYNRL